jgi:hypothetical protein
MSFYTNIFVYIGIFLIIFIISVSLLIFAPKSKNYYKKSTFPNLEYINNINQLIKDEFYKIKNCDNWVKYPDSKNINGNCEIWPLYMFDIESKSRTLLNKDIYDIIKTIPDIKSCLFIKIDSNSEISKNILWKDLSNETLRCLIILDSPNDSEKCCVWVNGEIKKIINNELLIFDGSKEHSIFNKTKSPLHMMIIDIKRPSDAPIGTSKIEYSDEVYSFIKTLTAENEKN